jgi:hypothetical protein
MNGKTNLINEVMEIIKLWFDDNKIFIETKDNQILWQSLLLYRRLMYADNKERNNYYTSFSGIHWADVDEDISFESFTCNNKEPEGISKLFLSYPELNASAVARRLCMKQSLLAAYISGTKKPSTKRENEIKAVVRQIGKELINYECP